MFGHGLSAFRQANNGVPWLEPEWRVTKTWVVIGACGAGSRGIHFRALSTYAGAPKRATREN